jgi:hypothetical protein
MPYKNTPGRPTSFWVDRQINPILYVWPTPIPPWNNLYFTYWESIQDIGAMVNSAEIPARFLQPLCCALAYALCMKEAVKNPNLLQMLPGLKADADEAYNTAGSEDRERVPLRIYGDYLQGWSTI